MAGGAPALGTPYGHVGGGTTPLMLPIVHVHRSIGFSGYPVSSSSRDGLRCTAARKHAYASL